MSVDPTLRVNYTADFKHNILVGLIKYEKQVKNYIQLIDTFIFSVTNSKPMYTKEIFVFRELTNPCVGPFK